MLSENILSSQKNFFQQFFRDDAKLMRIMPLLIQNIIIANPSGTLVQCALYLYGSSDCRKSEFIHVFKSFCQKIPVKIVTRFHNRFYHANFEKCRFLILDNVHQIQLPDLELLKAWLGRDTLAVAAKFYVEMK